MPLPARLPFFMEKSDYILRGLIKDLNIRFMLTEAAATVSEAVRIHDTDPVSSILFGQALIGGLLCTPLLEGAERYTIRWDYKGMLRRVVIDANAEGHIRGIPTETRLMSKAGDETDIYGEEDGSISVIKSDSGKILNSGMSKAGLLDLADDLAFFFSVSDQLETEIESCIVLNPSPERPINCAAGVMLQAMPGCDLEAFARLRMELHNDHIQQLLREVMPCEKKLWKIIEELTAIKLPEASGKLAYSFAGVPEYRCTCTREKLLLAMRTLGDKELRRIFDSNGTPAIKCEFCNRNYHFKREDFFPGN